MSQLGLEGRRAQPTEQETQTSPRAAACEPLHGHCQLRGHWGLGQGLDAALTLAALLCSAGTVLLLAKKAKKKKKGKNLFLQEGSTHIISIHPTVPV